MFTFVGNLKKRPDSVGRKASADVVKMATVKEEREDSSKPPNKKVKGPSVLQKKA